VFSEREIERLAKALGEARLRASLRRLAHKNPPAGQHGNAVPDVTGRPAL
jgi:hypothetical protein